MSSKGVISLRESLLVELNDDRSILTGTLPVQAEDATSSNRLRRNSELSENSATSEIRSAVACDSGNYSTGSNASEVVCPIEIGLHNHCQHVHALLKEKDNDFNIAMQDVRKLRSELERRNKSEEWYKKELRSQKTIRLEALERLYAQEREYMLENQRLQRECMRLYDKCGIMENELQTNQDAVVQKLDENEKKPESRYDGKEIDSKFKLEQQRLLIDDQQKLLIVLRKQKHDLLKDLSLLNEEKDARVMELQETLAGVEVENTHMIGRCKRFIIERQALEDTVQLKNAALIEESTEMLKMKALVEELKQQAGEHEKILADKEHEINDIQKMFKRNMQNETNMDEVHRLSISYHHDIHAKTAEITSLKKSLQAVQNELEALTDLQAQNDEQQLQIQELNFTLKAKQCELTNLQETDIKKTWQISELQRDLVKISSQRDNTLENLYSAQTNMKSMEQELIVLHDQYSSMCALCEKTRFDLELLEIEKAKLKFQAESDKREIKLLRRKLKAYLRHTEELGARINDLEAILNCSNIGKEELKMKLRELETQQIFQKAQNQEEPKNKSIEDQSTHNDAAAIIKINQNDDSGFLDASSKDDGSTTNSSVNNNLSYNEVVNANKRLLDHLNAQSDILKKRREMIDAFQNHIFTKTISKEEIEDNCLDNREQNNDFLALLKRQEQLMEFLNHQPLLAEKEKHLVGAFKTLVNRDVFLPENSIQNYLKKYTLTKGSNKEINLATLNECAEIATSKQILPEKVIECEELQNLREKQLESEEKHMQKNRYQGHLHRDQVQTHEDVIQRLQSENVRLTKELQNSLETKSDIESAMDSQRQLISNLKTKLVEFESGANLSVPQLLTTAEKQELQNLREKVEELEDCLQVAMQRDKERRKEKICLIRKLLEQQNSKVKQLTESQEEWEELLVALYTAQKLEENTRAELQLKHAELDEINALFAEQNEELQRLQETIIFSDHISSSGEVNVSLKFQRQVREMQMQLSTQFANSEAQQRRIEELQDINKRLERRLNEDYAAEVANNQKRLRNLQQKIEYLQTERNDYAARLLEKENEMQQLKNSKREAFLLPPDFVILPVTEIAAQNIESLSSSRDENTTVDVSHSDNEDRMKILSKVLESEYRRKMKRYDLHIHTLLNNIKKLKKSLCLAEKRAANLTLEQSRTKDDLANLQLTKSQLKGMRLRCEQNQHTIKALEHALEMERKKFEASDLGKSVLTLDLLAETLPRDESAHEVANLIDDYKKLIKESALATQRPKTSTIFDLIERSNQCVPNLHKLETSVDGLRIDLEHFLRSNVFNMPKQYSENKCEPPSLMEELRTAAESC